MARSSTSPGSDSSRSVAGWVDQLRSSGSILFSSLDAFCLEEFSLIRVEPVAVVETVFPPLKRGQLTTLQVNLGYRCNQSCAHCHVNAGRLPM